MAPCELSCSNSALCELAWESEILLENMIERNEMITALVYPKFSRKSG